MKGDFKPATLEQYIEWLTGWIKHGGLHLTYNDFRFVRAGFLFTDGTFVLRNEQGRSARRIIVGKSGTFDRRTGGLGHNELYFLDGFQHIEQADRRLEIPVYSDREFRGVPGLTGFIRRESLNRHR